jgi:hypothetical protein
MGSFNDSQMSFRKVNDGQKVFELENPELAQIGQSISQR